MVGDIPIWHNPYEATMEQCARDCLNLHNCKSFSHSITDNVCKLMEGHKLTGNGLYEQQGLYGPNQYCTRGNF